MNLPNGLKFLKEFVESVFAGVEFDGDKVKAKDLSDAYKNWCDNSGVKFHLGTFKTQLKKIDIEDKTSRYLETRTRCYVMNAEILRTKYRDYLKDDTF